MRSTCKCIPVFSARLLQGNLIFLHTHVSKIYFVTLTPLKSFGTWLSNVLKLYNNNKMIYIVLQHYQSQSPKSCLMLFCSIRALYGTDEQRNAAHGSDNYLNAEREIRFFFHDSQ